MTTIKRMALMTRKSGASSEAFNRYWLDVHGALVKQSPGVLRYQQNPVLEEIVIGRSANPPFRLDGVVELWFGNQADMDACFSSPTGRQLPEDEERFLDQMTRHDVVDAPQPDGSYKILLAATGRSAEEGARTLSELIPSLATALGQPDLPYVLNPVRGILSRPNLPAEPVPAGAFLQFLFAGEASARKAMALPPFRQALEAAAPRFTKLGAYLVFERRVV